MEGSSSSLMQLHFFQPLLPDFESSLSIPKSFLKHLARELEEIDDDKNENYATLRDKRCDIWYVKLIRSDNKLLFKDGWKKFCEDRCLEVGDFLVFRHQGGLLFDVYTFDPTACERECPCITSSRPKISTEHADFFTMDNEGRKSNAKRLKRVEDIHKACSEAIVTFKPRGYPHFQMIVQPSFYKSGGMVIPAKFSKENGLRDRRGDLILVDQKGEQWTVQLRHHRFSTYIKGWTAALKRSFGFKAGDRLVFELIISGIKPVMKLYALNKSNKCHDTPLMEQEKLKPIRYPSFQSVLKPYWSKWGGMPIPRKFARDNDLANRRCEIILIDQIEKPWSLTLKQSGNTTIIGGWSTAQQANLFKNGDRFVFELISNGEKPVIRML